MAIFDTFFAKTCLEMGQNLFESLQKLDILKELAFLVYKNIISSILGFMGQQKNLRLQLSQSSASSLEPCLIGLFSQQAYVKIIFQVSSFPASP